MFCRPSRGIVVLTINGIFLIHCTLGNILYYIILYYIILYYIILYYIMLFAALRLESSRRTRRFAQDSTVRAGLYGSRRTRQFSQTELDGSRRTRRFAQDSTLLAATAPASHYSRVFIFFDLICFSSLHTFYVDNYLSSSTIWI